MIFEFKEEYGKYCGIYRITNCINGKVYIGQTLEDFYHRYTKHKYESTKRPKRNKLHHSIVKYGIGNFSFDILHFTNNENEIDDLERYYINKFDAINNGLNLDSGGNLNKHHCEETKRKIGLANIGNTSFKGKKHTEETKKLMSRIKTGKKMSMAANLANSSAKLGNQIWLGKNTPKNLNLKCQNLTKTCR